MNKTLLFLAFAAFAPVLNALADEPTKAEPAKTEPTKPEAAKTAPVKVDGHKNSPMLPGGKWHVNDMSRPQPAVVTPGACGKPASDAIVLYDGTDLSKWRSGKEPAKWKSENGVMTCVPSSGYLFTAEEFGDIQLHVEFATPSPASGKGQGRGNSGVFLMGIYEVQVLDSYENPTYPDGQAGAIYGQHPPLVNASLPSGEWQTYDIVFTAPRFAANGSVETPAYVTALHNGVLVQNHQPILGDSGAGNLPVYKTRKSTGPLALQDHHNPIRYRNIWVRPLHLETAE